MKHIVILHLGLFLLSCGQIRRSTLAVYDETQPKIESTFQGLHARQDKEGPKRDRLILDIHYNEWLGDRASIKTGWNSIGFNGNALLDLPFNKKSKFAFATGIRFGRSSAQHDGLFLLNDSIQSSILFATTNLNSPRTKQRFIHSYLEIPAEFRFRGEELASFRFSIGGSIGVNINSYEKWREMNNKFREYNHHNTKLLRAGAYLRVGYNRWNVFGAFYFTPLFHGALDSQLNVIQLGISLSLF